MSGQGERRLSHPHCPVCLPAHGGTLLERERERERVCVQERKRESQLQYCEFPVSSVEYWRSELSLTLHVSVVRVSVRTVRMSMTSSSAATERDDPHQIHKETSHRHNLSTTTKNNCLQVSSIRWPDKELVSVDGGRVKQSRQCLAQHSCRYDNKEEGVDEATEYLDSTVTKREDSEGERERERSELGRFLVN